VWTISVGDSAESWAKAAGKLVAGKYPAEELVLDFSEIRPAGYRLKGYGWISSGDHQVSKAFAAIAKILSDRADQLLTAIDILDICNHLGTVLSSRRSAQIALLDFDHPEVDTFAAAKKNYWQNGNDHRRQSNNSVVFSMKPSQELLEQLLYDMYENGGSEPGIVNAETAKRRAPWFRGFNPCVEIILGNKSFCNLVELNLLAFHGDQPGLLKALHLLARANYRQTLVNLRDEIQ
jgi:ribonucleoside-triphosphate reductase (formate)